MEYKKVAISELKADQIIRLNKIFKLYKSIIKPNMKILDIGCFYNNLLKEVKDFEPTLDLYGIDIEADNPKFFKFKQVDVNKGIPFEDNFFDIISINEVIEHLTEDKFVLREINRCLKPSGYVILTTPNLTSLQKRIQILFGVVPEDLNKEYDIHNRFNNFKTISKKLIDSGFKIERKLTNNIPFPINKTKFLRNFVVKMGDYFYSLGNQIIILAKT